jgi:hypothetical protein
MSGEVRRGQVLTSAGSDPPRPTPTQAFRELAMAVAQRASSSENSVSLSRNARGVVQIEVVARGDSLSAVSQAACEEFDALCTTYPYPVTNGGTE